MEAQGSKENKKGKGKKRSHSLMGSDDTPPVKQPRYELTSDQQKQIKLDNSNKKLWQQLMDSTKSFVRKISHN